METEILRQLGLTEYESKAYMSLLRYGDMKGREVAGKSGVPPTRVFDALKSLMSKGFVSLISNKPMIFKPVKAEIAIKGIVEEKTDRLQTLEKSAIDSLKNFAVLKQIPSVEEKIIIVSGYEKMYSIANEMMNRVKKSMLIFSSGEKIPNSTKIASAGAIKRGVSINFIATQCSHENINFLKELKNIGYRIRFYKADGYTIAIQDSESCVMTFKNPSEPRNRITIFLDNENFSKALVIWFNTIWKMAKAIKL